MTDAIALTGQWEGLRAFPRAPRTPDHRKRLENGLERLGGLYEQMAARAALLAAGMERLNGLRAGMIDQLDAIDGDTDLEEAGDLEPSLCHPAAVGSDDLEDSADDHGEPWLGWGVERSQLHLESSPGDLEAEHDGREPPEDAEPDCDAEPDEGGSCAWPEEGDQTTLPVTEAHAHRVKRAPVAAAVALAERTRAQMAERGRYYGHLFRTGPQTSNVGPLWHVGPDGVLRIGFPA